MKPEILLLGEVHSDAEVHKRQAEEVLKFNPEVCLLEMYEDPTDAEYCETFSERSLDDLKKNWKWVELFDTYLPLIEAIRKTKAKVRPLTLHALNTGEIDEEKDVLGNHAMKDVICKYSGGANRIAIVCGYGHIIGERGARGEGLKYLLEDGFTVMIPQYAKENPEFGKFMV